MPVAPSDKEEEYFARIEFERKKKAEEERLKSVQEAERQRLKELHYMRCPKCGMGLTEMEYAQVTVDKCFSCGGIYLDAGELELIITLEKEKSDSLFRLFRK